MDNSRLEENKVLSNINANDMMSDIIGNLSDDFIEHICMDSIRNEVKFRPYESSAPNIPACIMSNARYQLMQSPDQQEYFSAITENAYKKIIDIICKEYHLSYNPSINIFSDSYMLYSFFVSDFTETMITFFVKYILSESDGIYSMLNLSDSKKSKDASTSFSKMLFDDNSKKLAIIHANLATVLKQMPAFDISLQTIISTAYLGEPEIAQQLISLVSEQDIPFYLFYSAFINNDLYFADMVTCIKMQLQTYI